MTRFFDLSVPVANDPDKLLQVHIDYVDHAGGAKMISQMFNIDPSKLPEGKYGSVEHVTASTHVGTHLDAPYHCWPTTAGEPAIAVDQIPLEWCFGDGVVLDVTHRKAGEYITVEDLRQAARKIEYAVQPLDIVLIRTDASTKHYFEPGYERTHPGMSKAGTLWLLDQGVKMIGIDAFGFDRPNALMAEEFNAGNRERFWECHWINRDRPFVHIENLYRLDQLPRPFGFKVSVFPIKLEKAGGAWIRAVAIFED